MQALASANCGLGHGLVASSTTRSGLQSIEHSGNPPESVEPTSAAAVWGAAIETGEGSMNSRNKTATVVVFGFCAITAFLGVLALVFPEGFSNALQRAVEVPAILYSAAIVRILLGTAICFAASAARAPKTLRVAGGLLIAAGLSLPVVGLDRVRDLVDWWTSQGDGFPAGWGIIAIILSGLLAYSLTSGTTSASQDGV